MQDHNVSHYMNIFFTFVVHPTPCIPSARLSVATLTYMMGVCNYLMRANLSVAIVCMNSDSFELMPGANHSLQNGTLEDANGTLEEVFTPEIKVSMISKLFICAIKRKMYIYVHSLCIVMLHYCFEHTHGSFWVWTQPMKYDATM